jgi:hypothetical protein
MVQQLPGQFSLLLLPARPQIYIGDCKTPARAGTPNIPHAMIRRSTYQQNLTNDMLAETIQQANFCSLPTGSTIRSPPQEATDTQIIIMPEMANAVICPESGDSLKHQELITMLRYKIKWMRSTANEIRRLYKPQYYHIYLQIKHATRTQSNIWIIYSRHQ